jgi:hypothetical protein
MQPNGVANNISSPLMGASVAGFLKCIKLLVEVVEIFIYCLVFVASII